MIRTQPSLATLLLIAPDSTRRALLHQRLEGLGYNVWPVTDAPNLMRLLQLGRCDLIVVDTAGGPVNTQLTDEVVSVVAQGRPLLHLGPDNSQDNHEWYEETLGLKVAAALRNRNAAQLLTERVARWDGLNVLDPDSFLFRLSYAEAILPLELERARRTYQPLTLALLQFQAVPAAPPPAYWRVLSAHILTCMRQIDIAARWNDDTILLVLPLTEPSDATVLLRRIQRGLSMLADLPAAPPSLTAGISAYPLHADAPATLLTAAQRAATYALNPGDVICFDQI